MNEYILVGAILGGGIVFVSLAIWVSFLGLTKAKIEREIAKINLVLDCSYHLSSSTHDEIGTVTWRFTLSLIDDNFYNKTFKRNFKNIKKFDKSLILSDLSGF